MFMESIRVVRFCPCLKKSVSVLSVAKRRGPCEMGVSRGCCRLFHRLCLYIARGVELYRPEECKPKLVRSL